MKNVLISTSSFGLESKQPLLELEKNGWQVSLNPYGRKLTPKETVELLKDKQAVIAGTESYGEEVLSQLPNLRLISRCGAGTDGIDRAYLEKKGIKLCNTPEVHITAVAELTLAGLLTLARKMSLQHEGMRKGQWEKIMGVNLRGKTVGILGYGKVGKAFAHLLGGFDCRILVYDPVVTNVEKGATKVGELDQLLEACDVISLHMPVADNTRGFFDARVFERLRPQVMLLNTARGELINEDALYHFLKNNSQAGAYLDVYSKEPYAGKLAELPNVVLTPHIGTFTRETRVQMELESVLNLVNNF